MYSCESKLTRRPKNNNNLMTYSHMSILPSNQSKCIKIRDTSKITLINNLSFFYLKIFIHSCYVQKSDGSLLYFINFFFIDEKFDLHFLHD